MEKGRDKINILALQLAIGIELEYVLNIDTSNAPHREKLKENQPDVCNGKPLYDFNVFKFDNKFT